MTHKGHQETNRSLTIRNAVPEDCQNILSLFINVFNIDRSEILWKWKYIDNPVKKFLVVVAEDNGAIVAHYALLPSWMVLNGSKILGALSMVHPNYRIKWAICEVGKRVH